MGRELRGGPDQESGASDGCRWIMGGGNEGGLNVRVGLQVDDNGGRRDEADGWV